MSMNTGLSPEQIGARRLGIGGGDAKAIMAGEWRELWRIKTRRAKEDDLSDVFAVRLGSWTEAFNCHWFEKTTGRAVTMRNETIVHPGLPYLRCNLDGLTTTARGAVAVIDFKHVGAANEAMLLRYTPQLTHNAIVLAAHLGVPVDWWVLSVIHGNKWCEPWEQAIDPFYAQEYLAQAAAFWSYVVADEEPPEPEPIAAPKPQPKLRTLLVPSEDDEVYAALVRQNNWLPEACKLLPDFAGTEPAAKKHAIVREELKRLVPDDIGEFRRGLFKLSRTRAGAVTMKMEKADG